MTATSTSLRAFDALAGQRAAGRGTPVPQLPLAQIGPLPGQPRQLVDEVALAELAESIKVHGVIQPILVVPRKDVAEDDPVRYRIVCGERRYRAAGLAGLSAIPALVRDYAEDEVALLALLENLQREDLTPLEEAEYLQQLKGQYGFTEEQLGERLGKSRDYVHMRLRLLNLAPDLVEAWRTEPEAIERLTPSHAILVNQVAEEAPRAALLQSVLSGGVTVAEVRRRVEAIKTAPTAGDAEEVQGAKLAAAQGLSAPLGAPLPAAPKRPKASPPALAPGKTREATVSLEDLAVVRLLEGLKAQGAGEVGLGALEAALKADLGWVRGLRKGALSVG